MIVINYFDWSGTREGLTRWVELLRSESEKHKVIFLGLYGPSQVKFNWAIDLNLGDDASTKGQTVVFRLAKKYLNRQKT